MKSNRKLFYNALGNRKEEMDKDVIDCLSEGVRNRLLRTEAIADLFAKEMDDDFVNILIEEAILKLQ